MFFSADSGISVPQLWPASLGESETLLHYDHHDLLFHCLLETPINKAVSSTQGTSIGPEVYPSSGDHNRPLHKHTRLQSEKKDRHSKIFTAQGPRGRRVRLSKDIARKFFDVQDLLGFDRASKTLDWLLTKSKAAIKELTQMEHIDGPSAQGLHSFSECENCLDMKKSTVPKKKRKKNPAKRKEAKALQMAAFDSAAKELRAKARARARERTKEKKFLREVTEEKRLPFSDPYIPNQAKTRSQIESCKSSDSNPHKKVSSVIISTGMNGFFCLQPNLVISRESSSNFSQWSPNTTENWDISSPVRSSGLCALTNMSSSTVLEISRQPFNFEEYSNNNERLMW